MRYTLVDAKGQRSVRLLVTKAAAAGKIADYGATIRQ